MIISNLSVYTDEIKRLAELPLPWSKIKGKHILLTGAGFISSCCIDLLMYRNKVYGDEIQIYLLSRNEERARKKFQQYFEEKYFHFIEQDLNEPFTTSVDFEYIIHGASNTHPVSYAQDPIGTITTNVFGTYHLLNNVRESLLKFILLSTVEIYGENTSHKNAVKESDCGYIDCNSLRAGYPESKRVSESLCQAYVAKKDLDISIVRLCRIYGPSDIRDSKASAQFIRNGINNEDIILKSKGEQEFSYLYITDAVSAILYTMFLGEKANAYNAADEKSNATLYKFANIVAQQTNTKVVFDLPNETEKKGFSVVSKALLDSKKLKKLGWKSFNDLESGIYKTIKILNN